MLQNWQQAQQEIALPEGINTYIHLACEFNFPANFFSRYQANTAKIATSLNLYANRNLAVQLKSDYDQLFAARLSMEYGAVHIAFENVDDKFVVNLENINNRIRAIDSLDPSQVFNNFVKLNDAFHLALVNLSRSTPLVEAYDKLGYGPQIGRRMYHKGVPDLSINIAEHDVIIKRARSNRRISRIR
ncbi:MAG: DNA-binding FadR family transcriptional regulator [Oceanospirillaceae bacterium]|jgi:DNA-binding FadR family transcriptional regulator